MILTDDIIEERINSTENLTRRLVSEKENSQEEVKIPEVLQFPRQENSLAREFNLPVFNDKIVSRPGGNSRVEIPSLPPSVESLVEDLEEKLRTARIDSSVLEILDTGLTQLKYRLDDVESPKELARILREMSQVRGSIKESEHLSKGHAKGNVIIYKPVMVQENHYDMVLANE